MTFLAYLNFATFQISFNIIVFQFYLPRKYVANTSVPKGKYSPFMAEFYYQSKIRGSVLQF